MPKTAATPGPAALIAADGRPCTVIAREAGLSLDTVYAAKNQDRWPAQWRTRTALRKALGLSEQAATKA